MISGRPQSVSDLLSRAHLALFAGEEAGPSVRALVDALESSSARGASYRHPLRDIGVAVLAREVDGADQVATDTLVRLWRMYARAFPRPSFRIWCRAAGWEEDSGDPLEAIAEERPVVGLRRTEPEPELGWLVEGSPTLLAPLVRGTDPYGNDGMVRYRLLALVDGLLGDPDVRRAWLAAGNAFSDRHLYGATPPSAWRDLFGRITAECPDRSLRLIERGLREGGRDGICSKVIDVLGRQDLLSLLASDDVSVREHALRYLGQLEGSG